MSGIPFDRVKTLIDAHYAGNQDRFRMTVSQIAAGLKDGRRKQMLGQLVNREAMTGQMIQLPREVRGVVYEPPLDETDLVLPTWLRTEFSEIAVEWKNQGRLFEHGLRPRNRLLFHGPPGNGKTTKASQFGRHLGLNVFALSLPDTVKGFVGESANNLSRAFGLLRAGHALILDEIDVLADERHAAHGAAAIREANHNVASLLTMLDRDRAGLLIATTNRKDSIDPAILRRFDEVLEFPPPTKLELAKFIEATCRRFGLPQSEWPEPGDAASYDAAYKRVVREARRYILRQPEALSAS